MASDDDDLGALRARCGWSSASGTRPAPWNQPRSARSSPNWQAPGSVPAA